MRADDIRPMDTENWDTTPDEACISQGDSGNMPNLTEGGEDMASEYPYKGKIKNQGPQEVPAPNAGKDKGGTTVKHTGGDLRANKAKG